jgi:4-hydroxybenzoate polyprenyltransferase
VVEASARAGTALLALWRLSRPAIWTVSLLPAYGGWILASRELAPGLALWSAFWAGAASRGATTAEFLATLRAWWASADSLAFALLALGPLLWTATLLWNDANDLASDRANPRKARSPLVQGLVSVGWATRMAWLAAALAVLAAALAGPWVLAFTAANLALAWLYSVPPVRLKARPGMDVAVNAVGVGVLSTLAGWSAAASPAGFPWPFLAQALLVGVAVYVPTTLVDLEADRAAGDRTIALRAYLLGWWAWVACNLGSLLLASLGYILPRTMLPLLAVAVPLLLGAYHAFIGRARGPEEMVKGIVLCSFLFLATNVWWALQYTGLWRA